MEPREQRIYEEAAALWREVFGDSPPLRLDGPTLLEIITRCSGPPPYDRLHSPYLRPSTISGPVKRVDETRPG